MSNTVISAKNQELSGPPLQGDASVLAPMPLITPQPPGNQGDASVPTPTDSGMLAREWSAPRVLFLGMQGNFSHPPLRALLEAGIQVCAVVIPAELSLTEALPAIIRREQLQTSRTMLPVLHSTIHTSILQLAWERHLPVWEVHRLSDPETIGVLAAYQPDVICVACFSKRIPHAILDIPRLGCLNVHPSLLPANRGPEPLFWTFREGSQQTGVTIHLMNEGMDSGPIVAQEAVEVRNGISYAQLEAQCAELGGKLLARSVWALYNGVAIPVPQDETKSSYHAFPADDDFVVPVAAWSAQHVYNFICGVASWGTPITLQVGNNNVHVKKVISYSHKDIDRSESEMDEKLGEKFWVRCKQGSILVM
jgi:methionyl-tRNA formyltransferase